MDELDVAARVLAMAVDVNAVEDMQDEVHSGAQAPHVTPTPAFEPSYGFEVSNADAPVSQKVEAAPRIVYAQRKLMINLPYAQHLALLTSHTH